jgi:uncharacterized protein YecA (UPF0149 family)
MSKDSVERFLKKQDHKKLDDISLKNRTTEDIEAEKEMISKAHEEAAKEPEKYRLKAGAAAVGRNDPCPCGSGKKYKKCCELKAEKK